MKRLIIILLIIAILAVPAYLIFVDQNSQDAFYTQLNEFDALLRQKEYEQAKIVYEQSSNTLKANYNISLEAYADTLIEEAKNQETTNDSLNLLYAYNEIGFNSTKVNDAILYYEDLLQSNYIFQKGLEYYSNNEFEEAMKCFHDVLDYDENYAKAQEYVTSYQNYNLAWDNAADNNMYGRDPRPSAIAYKDSYMYIPYRFSNSNAILKINTNSFTVLSFPIISTNNGAEISNINIVGDYLFFLLKQHNPNSEDAMQNAVYRISLDGADLIKMTDCDYTYLITYQDEFYAISQSKGLVKADNYFVEEEILVQSDNEIVKMQMVDDGMFYTVEDVENEVNIEYFYDGETSEEVKQDKNMHCYHYDEYNIIYYDISGASEYLYRQNNTRGTYHLYTGDIYEYYGKLNESIIFTFLGEYQQECIRVIDVDTHYSTYRADVSGISYVPIGILYDQGMVVLKSDEGISLTTENMRIQQTIQLPHINNTILSENEQVVSPPEKSTYFTDEAVNTTFDDRWLYSDEGVSISTEKFVIENIENTIYVSNIFTNHDKWLQSLKLDKTTSPLDAQENMIWAVPAQSYNLEPELINEENNIIKKDVYVFNDDGMFIPYRESNFVSSDKILSSKVVHIFSEGEVILENYSITEDCLEETGVLTGRSAVGMVEPGHYVFITVENRGMGNKGITLYRLAKIFKEAGCISAFCFDSDYNFNIFNSEYVYDGTSPKDSYSNQNEILYYTVD